MISGIEVGTSFTKGEMRVPTKINKKNIIPGITDRLFNIKPAVLEVFLSSDLDWKE